MIFAVRRNWGFMPFGANCAYPENTLVDDVLSDAGGFAGFSLPFEPERLFYVPRIFTQKYQKTNSSRIGK